MRKVVVFISAFLLLSQLSFAGNQSPNPKAKQVMDYWSKERRDQAIPRDLVIDNNGQGYLRKPDGSFVPYGQSKNQVSQSDQVYKRGPSGSGGGSDTIEPEISAMTPQEGETIGESSLFSAQVTDASGIKSVTFVITYPDGSTTQSFSASYAGSDTWQTTLRGFTDGDWSWHVVAKDGASKGGNTATSASVNFIVDSGNPGGDPGGDHGGETHIIENAEWTSGGAVQTASGRIYFEMPGNEKRKGPWSGYVCSGTVTTELATGRSIIITAAHCVYDDANQAFARNVLFIPNQAGTTSNGTDLDCNNDPVGCWATAFGVVDVNWTTSVFPANVAWDYAYYVVSDIDAHSGSSSSSDALDTAVATLPVNFALPNVDDSDPSATSADFTHALGYSYNDDPNFMYCAEDMTTESAVNWWLPSCGLSGGSSGGPWVQPMDLTSGSGPIISVNSWGYTTAPGMAGPLLSGTSAECLFVEASGVDFASVPASDGDQGIVVDYCP